MASSNITPERLREVLHYAPESGVFTWAPDYHGGRLRSHQVGHVSSETGHVNIRVFRRSYEAHRLAWLYMTGAWPETTIDHINRVPDDNRWENLREATMTQQRQNQKRRSDNTHGYKGLELHGSGLWRVRIGLMGKRIHIGYFKTPEEAMAARKQAELKYFTHSEFCRPPSGNP